MSNPRHPAVLCVAVALFLAARGPAQEKPAPPPAWEVSVQAAQEAGERLDAKEQERLLWKALKEAEDGGAPALKRAEILDKIGVCSLIQGRKEEAENLLLRALDMKKECGTDHPSRAITLRLLSDLLFSEGRYVRSEELMLEAFSIQKQALPPGDPERVETLLLLGALYQGIKDYPQAEKAYLDGLREAERASGDDHPHLGTGLGMLLDLYKQMGEPEKKRKIQERYDALNARASQTLAVPPPSYPLPLRGCRLSGVPPS